jgi:hypothetical protein
MEIARVRLDEVIDELRALRDPATILEIVEIIGPIVRVCRRRQRREARGTANAAGDG